ncbi:hypothetical protein AUEXF2481DRAFT_24999 [Aureobasidium subglaciale EXF-2481]|uniref:Uncharacterized protein n=1 Tax=Aureobasidium subglaciale (strain EXF-2481) TaxID=1043005 RepID=A0A074YSP8_AURSE|nr:uncharacterized protein AUEXF2481DRAFT_24999 [Aureobasidium subglaciale EXF-2481]KER00706.1 hypothetical protein AUEXF2481DRAFT_24999 [Aureobasidium subglaciale EXF-2481]
MPLGGASLSSLSASERQQVLDTFRDSGNSTTAAAIVCSLLLQKRKHTEMENDDLITGGPTINPEMAAPSSRLRKRARVSYVEPAEFDIESDADSGYNSDSSVEWGPRSNAKQTKTKSHRKEKPTKPVKPFPFLSLPTELRNKIYFLALEDPNGMVLGEGWRAHRRVPVRTQHFGHGNKDLYAGLSNLTPSEPLPDGTLPDSKESQRTLIPSILAVNKQIYAEAAAILYAQPLHFINTVALHSFLAPMSDQTASLIRNITVHTYETWGRGVRKAMNVSALTLLRSCKNIEHLRIEAFHHYYFSSSMSPRESGAWHGALMARQMYRDGSFFFERLGAAKALKVLYLPEMHKEISRQHSWSTQVYDDEVETWKCVNIAFAEELTSLIDGRGKGIKRGKKRSRAAAFNVQNLASGSAPLLFAQT